jgi:MYXO-CTERM domain-containing protein
MRRFLGFLLWLCVAVTARSAGASSCVETAIENQIAQADVVFVGKALKMDAELATTFEVETVYKGSVPAKLVVHTDRVKYAMMDPPDRYLVLASLRPGPDGRPIAFNEVCSGTRRMDASAPPATLGAGHAPDAELTSGGETPVVDAGEVAPPDESAAPPPALPAPRPVALAPAPVPVEHSGCAACRVGPRAPETGHRAALALPLLALLALARRRGFFLQFRS